MEFDKIANLDPEELVAQERQAAEQLFRLRFQMRLGQNEGLKKLRELKKDIARMKTLERQRALGIGTAAGNAQAAPAETRKPAKGKPAKGRTKTKAAAKARGAKTAKRSTRSAAGAKRGATSRAHTPKRGRANAKKGS